MTTPFRFSPIERKELRGTLAGFDTVRAIGNLEYAVYHYRALQQSAREGDQRFCRKAPR